MFVYTVQCFQEKRQNKMLYFLLIYQTLVITCVNSEKLIKTNTRDMSLIEAGAGEAEQNTNLYINSNNNNISNNSNSNNNIMCGNTQKMADNCFRDLPPHLMEFLQTSKIAINEQDIVSKCNVFRRGMKCFDDYTSRCIPSNNINILNNNVEGAKKFFTKFCEDKTFQQDYLSHKECFSYIQEDWMHCTKNFQNILSEGLHSDKNITEKFLEFCCARYAYETCIYNSARYKCYQNSAAFARATAQMLSDEKHFSNCRQFEVSTCGSTPVIVQLQLHCHWTLWLAITLLFMIKNYQLMS
ncbi:hypothetical protein FF38_11627 [Lucilia cuprina]|uniref:DUF19 domain-containing protein n=1 Tax=Lucilia cuprina TaxID=7375 RepID=A0A0L0CGL7_LUCCU|nr:hypothetical protein CVS40_6296 [Lucilia cuprina]KNC30654.1 hypothetical protein FF38_11627 [Lucilia cuprina]